MENITNIEEDKIKKALSLKLVIRPKSRHIPLTFNQEYLFLAENILAFLKGKDGHFFSCLYRKITQPSRNTTCQTSVQQNKNKNSPSLYTA